VQHDSLPCAVCPWCEQLKPASQSLLCHLWPLVGISCHQSVTVAVCHATVDRQHEWCDHVHRDRVQCDSEAEISQMLVLVGSSQLSRDGFLTVRPALQLVFASHPSYWDKRCLLGLRPASLVSLYMATGLHYYSQHVSTS